MHSLGFGSDPQAAWVETAPHMTAPYVSGCSDPRATGWKAAMMRPKLLARCLPAEHRSPPHLVSGLHPRLFTPLLCRVRVPVLPRRGKGGAGRSGGRQPAGKPSSRNRHWLPWQHARVHHAFKCCPSA